MSLRVRRGIRPKARDILECKPNKTVNQGAKSTIQLLLHLGKLDRGLFHILLIGASFL